MSTKDRWLLPDGVEEVLPAEARRVEGLRRRLLDLFETWGYEFVMPPLIEYLESLLVGASRDLDTQTFKVTDHLTGRLMGVRPDMTPQAARLDAHYLKRGAPTRLCYVGSVLRTKPDGLGGSRGQQFSRLGLMPGDLVTAINGTPLDDPARGMEILQSINTAAQVTVTVERNGQSSQININNAALAAESGATEALPEAIPVSEVPEASVNTDPAE